MPIKYSLSENKLVTSQKVYRATTQATQHLRDEDLYRRMADSGTTLRLSDIMACMQLYNHTLETALKEGCFIATRHGNYRPGIKGNFDSPHENFTTGKHRKHVSISAGTQLEAAIQEAHAERVPPEVVAPQPTEFLDSKSKATNSSITPGGMALITGTRLNFSQTGAGEGIYFIADDDSETKVTDILEHSESKISLLIPASLTAGKYKLEIRAAYTQNAEIRSGQLPALLTAT